jgi:hypothetical protein
VQLSFGIARILRSRAATDQDGNTYVFNYSNEFRATLDEGVYSGFMTDAFAVAGPGPAQLNNGFVGNFESDFATFFTLPNVISSHGDPLDFVTGDVHCDRCRFRMLSAAALPIAPPDIGDRAGDELLEHRRVEISQFLEVQTRLADRVLAKLGQ